MTTKYAIKEMFYTLQGEGHHSGQAAVFCRFSACNLWSGNEKHRATASCRFCDTDFVGVDGTYGGRYHKEDLVQQILDLWPHKDTQTMVVFTGGEPLLQLDQELVDYCKEQGLYVAVETNGTKEAPNNIDWICISPKPRSTIVLQQASEIKLVYPQMESQMHPSNFERFPAAEFFLQPLDNENQIANITAASQYCLEHPQWRLSIQIQKIVGLR